MSALWEKHIVSKTFIIRWTVVKPEEIVSYFAAAQNENRTQCKSGGTVNRKGLKPLSVRKWERSPVGICKGKVFEEEELVRIQEPRYTGRFERNTVGRGGQSSLVVYRQTIQVYHRDLYYGLHTVATILWWQLMSRHSEWPNLDWDFCMRGRILAFCPERLLVTKAAPGSYFLVVNRHMQAFTAHADSQQSK